MLSVTCEEPQLKCCDLQSARNEKMRIKSSINLGSLLGNEVGMQ